MRKLARRFAFFGVIFLLGFVLLFWVRAEFFRKIDTKFDVTAVTESISNSFQEGNVSPISFKKFKVKNRYEVIDTSFSGTFAPATGAKMLINRVGLGHVNVLVSQSDGTSVGSLTTRIRNMPEIVLGDYVQFFAKDLKVRGEQGHSIIIPLAGSIHLGNAIDFQSFSASPAVLREGKVTMFGKSRQSDSYYDAGSVELLLGDQLYFDNPTFQSSGFALINETPGINVAYETVAKEASIIKPGVRRTEEPLKISTAVVTSFLHDRFFQGVSILFGSIIILLSIITFFLDIKEQFPRGKQSKTVLIALAVGLLCQPDVIGTQVLAQATVWVKGEEMGRGITKERAGEAFVVLPKHVVEGYRGEVEVVGESNVKSKAVKVRSFGKDLALLKIETGGKQDVRPWRIPDDFRLALSEVSGPYIELRQKFGTSTRMYLALGVATDDKHSAKLMFPDRGSFEKGMSGGSVFGQFRGERIYLGMVIHVDTKKQEVIFLQADDIQRTIDRFFDIGDRNSGPVALVPLSDQAGVLERDIFQVSTSLNESLHELGSLDPIFIEGIRTSLDEENTLGAYIQAEIESVFCSQKLSYRFSCSGKTSSATSVQGKLYQNFNSYKLVLSARLASGRQQSLVSSSITRTPAADAMFGKPNRGDNGSGSQELGARQNTNQSTAVVHDGIVVEGVHFRVLSREVVDGRLKYTVQLTPSGRNLPLSLFVKESFASSRSTRVRVSQAQTLLKSSSIQLNLQLSRNQMDLIDFWIDGSPTDIKNLQSLTLQIKTGGGHKKAVTLN